MPGVEDADELFLPCLGDDADVEPRVEEVRREGHEMLTVLWGLLTEEECARLCGAIDCLALTHVADGGDGKETYDKRVRDCLRAIANAPAFTQRLWKRAAPYLGAERVNVDLDDDAAEMAMLEGTWEATGLNERVRAVRYAGGGHFSPHCDSSYEASEDEMSMLTFQLYLNGGFGGGTTDFLRSPDGKVGEDEHGRMRISDAEVWYRLVPQAGACVAFRQLTMLHEGTPLEGGPDVRKYLVRSDVMFRRTARPELSWERAEARKTFREAEQAELAGKWREAAKLYSRAMRLDPSLDR